MIKPSDLLAFDVETGGTLKEYALQPFRFAGTYVRNQSWINTDAIAWLDGKQIKTKATRQPSREQHHDMLVHAARTGKWIVGWNVAFDVAWLVAEGLGPEVEDCRFLDAMLLYQHLFREPEYEIASAKKRSWSLKNAVREFIPNMAGYEEDVNYQPETEEDWQNLLKYNARDSKFTLFLAIKFLRMLNEQSPRQLRNALIEAAAIGPVAHTYVQGLCVDSGAIETLDDSLTETVDQLGVGLQLSGVTDKILASPVQLRKKLYDDWQLPILRFTDKGAPSTDKVALYLLAAHDERAKVIKEYRENVNNRTKFVRKIHDSLEYNGDGRTRPAMRVYGTYTGRATFSSKQGRGKDERQTGFAIHQMKSDKDFRRGIEAPKGYTMVEHDAAGQEYRWMAVESGDDTMLSLCMPGEDPHSFMGASIGHVEYDWMRVHKDDDPEAGNMRKMGKMGNLSCVAEDTEICTRRGQRGHRLETRKRIADVRPDDLVWDGANWVSHGGVIYQGEKPVIEYGGLRATEDHLVLWLGKWIQFGTIARNNMMGFGKYTAGGDPESVYDILNCGPRNRFVANGLIVHNCQFRIGWRKLHTQAHVQFNMPISEQEAQHVHRTYHGTYRGVKRYWARKIAEAKRKGYAETLAGRRVILNGSWTSRAEGWKLESTAVNFPIQGIGADQKYLAIKMIQPYLTKYGGYLYFELHDGLYTIFPDAVAMKAGKEIQRVLSNMPYKQAWGFAPPIPLPWDMKIGPNWGDLKPVE